MLNTTEFIKFTLINNKLENLLISMMFNVPVLECFKLFVIFPRNKSYTFDKDVISIPFSVLIHVMEKFHLIIHTELHYTLIYFSKRSLTFSRLSFDPTNVTMSFLLNLV